MLSSQKGFVSKSCGLRLLEEGSRRFDLVGCWEGAGCGHERLWEGGLGRELRGGNGGC